jgi:hypothetical protein
MVGIMVEIGRNLHMDRSVTQNACHILLPLPDLQTEGVLSLFFFLPPLIVGKEEFIQFAPFCGDRRGHFHFSSRTSRLILSDKRSSSAIVTALNIESLGELFLTSSLPKPFSSLTRGTAHFSSPSWEDSAYSLSCCTSYPVQLP